MEQISDYPHLAYFAEDANNLLAKIAKELGLTIKTKSIEATNQQYHEKNWYLDYMMEYEQSNIFLVHIEEDGDTYDVQNEYTAEKLKNIINSYYDEKRNDYVSWEMIHLDDESMCIRVEYSLPYRQISI